MSNPARQNLQLVRGDTLSVVAVMTSDGSTPIDISGRVYSMQMRTSPESPAVSATFTCTVTNPTAGEVTCFLPASDTENLTPQKYSYDLQENASGTITTVISGFVKVIPDTTR
jgi:hypothetical protein